MVEASGRIGLVAMLVVGAQRAAQKRNNGQVSPATLVLPTLLIAALYNSLRRKVQEAVDRRFYRRKYDAEGVLAAFTTKARVEVDIERLSASLVDAIEETVQQERVSVWLKNNQR